jgi:hypothetical protein
MIQELLYHPQKPVIPGGIPILGWIPRLRGRNSRQNHHLSRVGRVLAHRVQKVLQMKDLYL